MMPPLHNKNLQDKQPSNGSKRVDLSVRRECVMFFSCLLVWFGWLFVLPCSMPSQATPQVNTDIQLVPGSDEVIFYGNRVPEPKTLNPEGMPPGEVTRRPFLYWKAWADQRLPVTRVFLALLTASAIISFAIEPRIARATPIYRQKWLRCFGVGILFFVIGLGTAGIMSRTGLFAPVAAALVVVVQLAGLVGLTVASQSIGERIFQLLKLEGKITKTWLKSLAKIFAGCLILSLLALIPGLGVLPRMGTRMLALIAAAGAGSFLISWRTERVKLD